MSRVSSFIIFKHKFQQKIQQLNKTIAIFVNFLNQRIFIYLANIKNVRRAN